jgi:hypothetical protein
VWTSFARYSDWCMLLVRTDPQAPKHKGITFLLVDMKSPGITVRPLRQINGAEDFNEMFFEDVRVPRANVIGEVNGGWEIAITTLMHERATLTFSRQLQSSAALGDMIAFARQWRHGSTPPLCDPIVRQQLAGAYIESACIKYIAYRSLTKTLRGGVPGPEGSVEKLFWSEMYQRILEIPLAIEGRTAAREAFATSPPCPLADDAVLPRPHDRRRQLRNPTEHHRGEGAASTARMRSSARLIGAVLFGVALALRLLFAAGETGDALYWDEVHYNAAAKSYARAWQAVGGDAPALPAWQAALQMTRQKGEAYALAAGLVYAVADAPPPSSSRKSLVHSLRAHGLVARHLAGGRRSVGPRLQLSTAPSFTAARLQPRPSDILVMAACR